MDTILQRIKEAYHFETDAEVADFLGIKPSTLSMQKNRGRLDLMKILKKCSDLNKNWLLEGVGPMRRKGQSKKEKHIPIYSSLELKDKMLDLSKSKREGSLVAESANDEYQLSSSDQIVGYVVTGDEMEPTLQKDDIAIIRLQKHLKDGAIFLVSLDRQPMLTRVEEKNGVYSLTTNRESFQLQRLDGYKVIGKLIWTIRKM